MVQSWHLAILRFAVTRHNADRLGALAIANEIDGLGVQHKERSHFGFFRRMTSTLCAAIVQQDHAAQTILRQYLVQVDDVRLKRALAAALGIGRGARDRSKPSADLWRGLRARGNTPH